MFLAFPSYKGVQSVEPQQQCMYGRWCNSGVSNWPPDAFQALKAQKGSLKRFSDQQLSDLLPDADRCADSGADHAQRMRQTGMHG